MTQIKPTGPRRKSVVILFLFKSLRTDGDVCRQEPDAEIAQNI
jgi:hypothetical protein